jgi:hypothetical protein
LFPSNRDVEKQRGAERNEAEGRERKKRKKEGGVREKGRGRRKRKKEGQRGRIFPPSVLPSHLSSDSFLLFSGLFYRRAKCVKCSQQACRHQERKKVKEGRSRNEGRNAKEKQKEGRKGGKGKGE